MEATNNFAGYKIYLIVAARQISLQKIKLQQNFQNIHKQFG